MCLLLSRPLNFQSYLKTSSAFTVRYRGFVFINFNLIKMQRTHTVKGGFLWVFANRKKSVGLSFATVSEPAKAQ